jgi:predicted dehydrogenase/nucleoside-diphosphate-sugar epimerase
MATDSQEKGVLRVAIAGAGSMAYHHAASISKLGAIARLVAVCDPHPASRERLLPLAPGAAQFDSLEAMFAEISVDVVHIVTPPASHAALAELAIKHDCHIYVEKPFVETTTEAEGLLAAAAARRRLVCAGHQLLFEPPARLARSLLPALDAVRHIESYFSFRVIDRSPDGRAPLRPDEQLVDILPHPVYTLLDFLRLTGPGPTRLAGLSVGATGTIHALFQRGPATGVLVVTVEGRPVESYLRIVGTNGSVFADFVRSTVQRHLGPGSGGIDKLLAPYRLARQLVTTTTRSMAKRFLGGQRSYPGLVEIIEAFYGAIHAGEASPVPTETILETVRVCEEIAAALAANAKQPQSRSHRAPTGPLVALTGGTGFLGRAVTRSLLRQGYRVRVLARRLPAPWDEIPEVDYRMVDLSKPLAADILAGCAGVIHCAAETAGGFDAHQANSVLAAQHIVEATADAGISRLVHMSSISVMAQPRLGQEVGEDSPLEPNSRALGPYAWGKTESEILLRRIAMDRGVGLRVVRPGAFVDYSRFEPPGLLGKRIGNIFVAIGSPREPLAVVDVNFTADTLTWMLHNFDSAPSVLHLMDPDRPTKADLVARLRATNPDIRVIWLPRVVLSPLSWLAILLQKVVRPTRPAMNVAKTFARQRYSTKLISEVAPAIRAFASGPVTDTTPANPHVGSRETAGLAP